MLTLILLYLHYVVFLPCVWQSSNVLFSLSSVVSHFTFESRVPRCLLEQAKHLTFTAVDLHLFRTSIWFVLVNLHLFYSFSFFGLGLLFVLLTSFFLLFHLANYKEPCKRCRSPLSQGLCLPVYKWVPANCEGTLKNAQSGLTLWIPNFRQKYCFLPFSQVFWLPWR